MSFSGSHWCRSTPDFEHRSMNFNQNRSTCSPKHRSTTPTESTTSCNAVRILTHEEFTARHPHLPSPVYVKFDRHSDTPVDRQGETAIDRKTPSHIDRHKPLTYRVQIPKIDVARRNAVKPQPKPSDYPPEAIRTPSDDAADPLEIDRVPMGRTLRKRNEKVAKHLKRGANEKERERFQKRVFSIPLEKPFEEAYFTHRLWMFFRETRETEEDIRRMLCEAREKMKKRITLKKKSDHEKFAIPCTMKGIEFPHALYDTGASVSILPRIRADHLGLQVEPSKESFTFVDCSHRISEGIVRDLEVQIGNALVPVDFHVLDIKLKWNSSLLLRRAFLSTVGAVCNLQTNQLCLTLIDPLVHYNSIPVKKPQTSSRRINDPGLIAARHCGAEYETEYSALIETHTATSIDTPKEESIDSSPNDWENDFYNPIMAVNNATPEIRDDLFDEEYRRKGILVYKFRPLKQEIQAQVETNSLFAEACGKGTHFSRISEENRRATINREIQESIDRANRPSIANNPPSSIDIRPKPPSTVSKNSNCDNQYLTHDEFGIFRDLDSYARAIDGHALQVSRENIADILLMANGADNLFMQQHTVPTHQQRVTKEFYDTAGGIDNRFKQKKFYWEENDEYGVNGDYQGCARNVDGYIINVSTDDIKKLMERASRDEHSYICLPEHVSSFTQTKLVPEIYTKDEINEMFYGVCGTQENNEGDFQMKLDGVYFPLNDSVSWLTTCMEEMRQDIAKIQHAVDRHRPTSIDRHHSVPIDDNPKNSHSMKSQPDFHTIAEIDQLVEGIYRTMETTEERLDRRCDDIYFPMDLSMSALTSKIETIQWELVEIQSYISRRPEASAPIDRRNNKSTDIHRQTSVDEATNRGRLVPKVTSDMSDTHNHGEEI
ncbi:hypothetical protein F2Q68_00024486 [Brassica cretica]|uniref:Uncharacterized protein n=1 Tax=Brassica cretica TaxID=69181 RepID=A0A8S9IHA4_BRACR|nr:hypothetical protein F2Q68_00024486 [Brassica cretica]